MVTIFVVVGVVVIVPHTANFVARMTIMQMPTLNLPNMLHIVPTPLLLVQMLILRVPFIPNVM